MNIFLTEICFDFQSRFFLEVSRATFKKVGKQINMKKNQLCESRFFLYFLHWQCKFFFIFCISNANCFYFWHWKCKLGINFLVNFSRWFDKFFFYFLHQIKKICIANAKNKKVCIADKFCVNFSRRFDEYFLFFSLVKQVFLIFASAMQVFFYFLHWQCKFFFYFLHWQSKFFEFFAWAMQIGNKFSR